MAPNISHIFHGERLIAENVQLSVNKEDMLLMIVTRNRRNSSYTLEDIHSLEWCFHESGPIGASKFEAFAVLKFASSQRIFDQLVHSHEPVVMVVGEAFRDFHSVQLIVIGYQRIFTPDVVKLLPFTQFPDSVKRVLPHVARSLMRESEKQIEAKQGVQKANNESHLVNKNQLDYVDLDDGVEAATPAPYYDIDGLKIQISPAGIRSLAPGQYMNDEAINVAFKMVQDEYPAVHVFDTYATTKIFEVFQNGSYESNLKMPEEEFNRSFGSFFYKNKNESLSLEDTFFGKKMLIFAINHIKHWFIVVVVNPLLCDINNYMITREKGHRAAAYYIDSLKGTVKYPHDLMCYRLSITWRCIFPFIRLAALYHANCYLAPKLISCYHENNIPSQINSFDCGPHSINNARLMAEKYDELMLGPESVEISDEKIAELRSRVENFRMECRHHLEHCKLKPQ